MTRKTELSILMDSRGKWRVKFFSSILIMLTLLPTHIAFLVLPVTATAGNGSSHSYLVGSSQTYLDEHDTASSSYTLNTDNYAKSYVQNGIYYDAATDKSYTIIQAGLAISTVYREPDYVRQGVSGSWYQDTWSCTSPLSCATSLPSQGVPVSVSLRQHGSLGLMSGATIGALYQFNSGSESYSFYFRLSEEGRPGFVEASASLEHFNGTTLLGTTYIPVTIKIEGDTVYFSYDALFTAYAGLTFTSLTGIGSVVNGGFVDATDPFTVLTTSLDPNIIFTSESGLSTAPVPEPATVLLLGLGLGIVVSARHKFRK